MWAGFEYGYKETFRSACCGVYVEMDMKKWFETPSIQEEWLTHLWFYEKWISNSEKILDFQLSIRFKKVNEITETSIKSKL